MSPRIRHKLDEMSERLQEVQLLLAQPATLSDGARFRELSRECSQGICTAANAYDHVVARRESGSRVLPLSQCAFRCDADGVRITPRRRPSSARRRASS